jgi:hypothetical protein
VNELRDVTPSLSVARLIEPAFWWGVSFAVLPALVGAAGVSYSGMAAFGALWRLCGHGEPPGLFIVLGGVLYGAIVGVFAPCLLFGASAWLLWRLASTQLAPLLRRVLSPGKVAVWVCVQVATAPISMVLSFSAYGLPWLFLGRV